MAVDARTASITGIHLGVLSTETHIDHALDTRNKRAFRLWCQRRTSHLAARTPATRPPHPRHQRHEPLMARRPCLDCGHLATKTRCPSCTRQTYRHRDQQRPSTADRGYGSAHQALRLQWKPRVEAGEVDCARCHQRIHPGTPWDLGHDDHDRTQYRGPEHVDCNRATANR